MAREDLLKELNEGFASLLDAVSGLSDDVMAEVWYDQWSVNAILAHIAGWHREMAPAFERLARGERPVPEGVDYSDADPINARFAEAAGAASPAAMIDELKASEEAFVAAARIVPEDRFEEGKTAYRILHTTGIEHYKEHEPAIREWRKSRGL
jgi:hypothetical protein